MTTPSHPSPFKNDVTQSEEVNVNVVTTTTTTIIILLALSCYCYIRLSQQYYVENWGM